MTTMSNGVSGRRFRAKYFCRIFNGFGWGWMGILNVNKTDPRGLACHTYANEK